MWLSRLLTAVRSFLLFWFVFVVSIIKIRWDRKPTNFKPDSIKSTGKIPPVDPRSSAKSVHILQVTGNHTSLTKSVSPLKNDLNGPPRTTTTGPENPTTRLMAKTIVELDQFWLPARRRNGEDRKAFCEKWRNFRKKCCQWCEGTASKRKVYGSAGRAEWSRNCWDSKVKSRTWSVRCSSNWSEGWLSLRTSGRAGYPSSRNMKTSDTTLLISSYSDIILLTNAKRQVHTRQKPSSSPEAAPKNLQRKHHHSRASQQKATAFIRTPRAPQWLEQVRDVQWKLVSLKKMQSSYCGHWQWWCKVVEMIGNQKNRKKVSLGKVIVGHLYCKWPTPSQ